MESTQENGDLAYLTKRTLIRKAGQAIRIAAAESMQLMGYVIIVQDGWLVRKSIDGEVERLHQLKEAKIQALRLD